MKGHDFWSVFLGANVPDAELLALGEDIGYMRASPSSAAASALLKIGYVLKQVGSIVTSATLFSALKAEMPGIFSRKSLLTGLASDYDDRKSYTLLRSDVRSYIDDVARHLPEPTKSVPVPKSGIELHTSSPVVATTPAPAAPKPKVPTGISQTEWDLLQGVLRKLQSQETASQVTAGQLAAARNIAARANLAVKEALDSEISARGEGAQDPSASSSEPARAGVGLGGILGVIALFFIFLMRR